MDPFQQQARSLQGTPPGPLAKLAAFILSATFLVLAFMFSLVALAVVAVGGIALGGWLWWKTRALRKQMREVNEQMRAAQPGAQSVRNDATGQRPSHGDQIIEGEFVREAEPGQRLG